MASLILNLKRTSRFYYNILNPDQKIVYNAIKKATENYEEKTVVEVSRSANLNDFVKMNQYVRMDNPLLYYLSNLHFSMMQGIKSNRLEITLTYSYLKIEVDRNFQKIKDMVEDIYYTYLADKEDDYSIEKAFHDYIVKNVFYHKKVPQSYKNEHNIIGPLLCGYGVCEGIAQATNLVMNTVGIKCSTIVGFSKKEQGPHAWNLIRIDKKNYHLDTTWDLSITEGIPRYDYFNLSDDYLGLDHIWHYTTNCDSLDHCYFYKNDLCISKKGDIKKVNDKIEAGERRIAFKIINQTINHTDIVNNLNYNLTYYYNETQRVLLIIIR